MVKVNKSKVIATATSMAPCAERTLAVDGDLPSLLKNHVKLVADYEVCKARHGSLTDTVDEFNR